MKKLTIEASVPENIGNEEILGAIANLGGEAEISEALKANVENSGQMNFNWLESDGAALRGVAGS